MELGKEEEKELNKLAANLAAAVNQTLKSSKVVDLVMDRIRHKGFTIELALIAHMTMYKKDKSKSLVKDTELLSSKTAPLYFEFNSDDIEFLKSLKISVSDENSKS